MNNNKEHGSQVSDNILQEQTFNIKKIVNDNLLLTSIPVSPRASSMFCVYIDNNNDKFFNSICMSLRNENKVIGSRGKDKECG